MGFDNESILNPETVPGEYCCPLCRQLVYPAEAQQTPCGHLFCRECVVYILGTTRCCPYDNRPINEADPKGLMQSNVFLYESLCRIPVRCVFHKSGCAWQGQLADAMTHSASCQYGSSPVFCNKCGMQIMHRQIPEHVVSCPGTAAQSKGPQQMPVDNQFGHSAPQHVLGPGQVVPEGHQVQQTAFGAQQIQQATYPTAHHVNGQDQPRPQSMAGGQSNQEQHYQHTHEPYQQYQRLEQPQQLQQLQQSRQPMPLPQTQHLSSVQKPYNVQESVPQQFQPEGQVHPYLQSQQSMLQQSQLSHERLPVESQHLHEQYLQSQNLLTMHPQQQAAASWEQQMHHKQMEHVRDGNLHVAHGGEQLLLHDYNISQHAGLPASMQQPSVPTRSNIQPWLGHPMATASDVRDPQIMQSFHNNEGYSALPNQILRDASPHPAPIQPALLASDQAAPFNAQNNELVRAKHLSASQVESGFLSAPSSHSTERGTILEKVPYGQPMSLHQQHVDQGWPAMKEGPAYGYQDAYHQTVRMPPSAGDDRYSSLADKQPHEVDLRLTASFPQRQGHEIPSKEDFTSGIVESEDRQSLLRNKNLYNVRQGVDSPKQQLSVRIHDGEEAEDGGDRHTLRMPTHFSNEPFSSDPTLHGSMRSQDRADTSKPLQPDVDRMMHLRRMINDYGKTPIENDHLHQQPFRDGLLGTHQSQRHPEIPHGYASESLYLKPPLAVSPVEGPLQLPFMEATRQATVGGYNGTSIESIRPNLDMPLMDNDRRHHVHDKSLLYKAGNLDAKEILHISSLSRFHASSPERAKAPGDFTSNYPTDKQGIGMRSSMIPFSSEIDKDSGLPREIGAERVSEVGLRKGQSLESAAWPKLPMEFEQRPRSIAQLGSDADKLYPDGPSRFGLSADLGVRLGTDDRDSSFTSLPSFSRRPGFPFDVEPHSKIPLDVEHRPFDADTRPRFPRDSGFRPGIDLELEHRLYGFPVDARRHPGLSLDIDGRTRLPDTLRDVVGRTPEVFGGLRSDFIPPAPEILSRRSEPGFSIRSPGRGISDFPIMREPGYRLGLPPQFDGTTARLPLHPGMELNRDPLNEDLRINIHRHSLLDDTERLLHVGGRNFPFSVSRPGVEQLPGIHPSLHSLIDEAPHDKMSSALEIARKRPQTGGSGWCRICLIDCLSIEGLREHSQTEDHQRKTLELVDSIKRDHPKRQKISKEDSRSEAEGQDNSKSEHEDDSRSEPADDSRSEAENNEKSNNSSSSPSSSKSE